MKKVFIVLLCIILGSIMYAQEGVTIDRNLNRGTPSNYKHSIPPLEEIAGNKIFDLMPKNMLNFMGKVDKEEFEIYVGEPVGYEDNFIVYEIESSYEKAPIAIRCDYHEKTGKLIHVHFPTYYPTAYDLGVLMIPKNIPFKRTTFKNVFGQVIRADITFSRIKLQVIGNLISYGYK